MVRPVHSISSCVWTTACAGSFSCGCELFRMNLVVNTSSASISTAATTPLPTQPTSTNSAISYHPPHHHHQHQTSTPRHAECTFGHPQRDQHVAASARRGPRAGPALPPLPLGSLVVRLAEWADALDLRAGSAVHSKATEDSSETQHQGTERRRRKRRKKAMQVTVSVADMLGTAALGGERQHLHRVPSIGRVPARIREAQHRVWRGPDRRQPFGQVGAAIAAAAALSATHRSA